MTEKVCKHCKLLDVRGLTNGLCDTCYKLHASEIKRKAEINKFRKERQFDKQIQIQIEACKHDFKTRRMLNQQYYEKNKNKIDWWAKELLAYAKAQSKP